MIMFTLLWIGVAFLLGFIFGFSDDNENKGKVGSLYVLSAIIVFISAPYLPESLYDFFRFW